MHEMNKDLPYEQQVKVLLRHYDSWWRRTRP